MSFDKLMACIQLYNFFFIILYINKMNLKISHNSKNLSKKIVEMRPSTFFYTTNIIHMTI